MLKTIVYVATCGKEMRGAARRPNGNSHHSISLWIHGAGAGTLVVAALAYWIGLHFEKLGNGADVPSASAIRLPPAAGASQPAIGDAALQIQPIQIARVKPPLAPTSPEQRQEQLQMSALKRPVPPTKHTTSTNTTVAEKRMQSDEPVEQGIWPAEVVEGAAGKLVRVGKFTTAGEAAKGWETAVRQDPGMERLQALPVAIKSLRDGHVYYRLQIGTRSAEHSAVVCDRLQKVHQSCTIIGTTENTSDPAS
jgi:hypothetical protein